ncbi:MAG: hypothetical protein JXC32_13020 [Anaerolineae bacterium]|nr:hypothetical protein [Anaerolineae bacterium]
MVNPEATIEERPESPDEAARCGAGRRAGRALGLTLLGAAIFIPAVCYYLMKHLWAKGKASCTHVQQPSAPEHPTQRITIPVQVVMKPEETAEADEAGGDVAEPEAAAPFVGSTESDKFHRPGCRWARNIDDAHRIAFPTREAALERGYVACSTCKP